MVINVFSVTNCILAWFIFRVFKATVYSFIQESALRQFILNAMTQGKENERNASLTISSVASIPARKAACAIAKEVTRLRRI